MDAGDPLGLVGQVIDGKYEVEAVAGSGGTAVVYRAMHLAWHRRVALKVVRVLGEMPKHHRDLLFAQLTREAGVLASLSERTSAIVQARDLGYVTTAGGHWAPYLVLEWVEGVSLDHVIERERAAGTSPRTMEEAVRLLEPIVHGLALAHHHGIAHRDVKPANIFVIGDARSPDAVTKILDFGIAKVVAEAHARNGGFARTERAFTAFTPAYGAPEQFSRDHGSTGPWTDVFGLALVLFELVTGRDAFEGGDLMEIAAAVCSETTRPSLRARGVTVPEEVDAVFARAVAVEPSRRPENAGVFWRDLRAALGLDENRLSSLPQSVSLPPLSADVGTDPRTSAFEPGALSVHTAPSHPLGSSHADEPEPTQPDIVELRGIAPPRAPRSRRHVEWLAAAALALAVLGALSWRAASRDAEPAALAALTAAPASASIANAAPPVPSCPAGMIRVPGGKFFMGSDDKIALDFERPAHRVTIGAFCMDRTEVTVTAYKRCSDQGECRRASSTNDWSGIEASDQKTYDPLCNIRDPERRGDHPINCVDWRMADEYCRAQGARLPTEAEWELAARGPDGRTYPWGDDAPSGELLNACGAECASWGRAHRADVSAMYKQDDGWPTTAPVGSFPKGASRFGIQDVVGNVWEWVADYYAPYDAAESVDPHGPASGSEHVIRGGGWNGSDPAWVRPTFRYKDEPEKKSHGIGFRCAVAPR